MKYLFLILFIVGCGSNLVAFSVDDNSFNIDRRIVDLCGMIKETSSCLEVNNERECEDELLSRFQPVIDDFENDKNFLGYQYCMNNELDKFTGKSCQSISDVFRGNKAPCREEDSSTTFAYVDAPVSLDDYSSTKCEHLITLTGSVAEQAEHRECKAEERAKQAERAKRKAEREAALDEQAERAKRKAEREKAEYNKLPLCEKEGSAGEWQEYNNLLKCDKLLSAVNKNVNQ